MRMMTDIETVSRHIMPIKRSVPGGFVAKEIRDKDFIFIKERSKQHMRHKPYQCDFKYYRRSEN